jgi:hypothetical protein
MSFKLSRIVIADDYMLPADLSRKLLETEFEAIRTVNTRGAMVRATAELNSDTIVIRYCHSGF